MTPFSRDERGQSAVLSVVFLTVLVGMAAIVLDVGSWYRADRATQATADAAALAAAQALPESPGQATALAAEYSAKNGGGATSIAIGSSTRPNDTVSVRIQRPAPGFFARVFGLDSVTVGSRAVARTGGIADPMWVAPVTVNEQHPMLQCVPACFGTPTTLDLANLHSSGGGDAAGAFGLLNLLAYEGAGGGSVGAAELASWMTSGFNRPMPLGTYDSAPSTNFSSGHFRAAMLARRNSELLFPVYRPPVLGSGSNARFRIIGWVGFRLTDFRASGSSGQIDGSFTRVVWDGLQATAGGTPDFGVRVVSLVE